MGAANSSEPRSVTLDNPNPAGVIDISDDVVQRLKNGLTKQARENATAAANASKSESTPSVKPTPPPKQESRSVPVKTAPSPKAASPPPRSPPVVYQNPSTVYLPSGITMNALDVQRQKELELQQNDEQWRKRMAQLEVTLSKTNAVMEKEYSAAVDDVRKRFATASPAHQLPPCQTLKAQVIACYRAHPGETLKCAEEVSLFNDCISVHRLKKLDAAEEAKPAPIAKAA